MYNNDYSSFPKSSNPGDTFQFRGRTYVYNGINDTWADSTIADPVDVSLYILEYRNPGESMSTVIISRPEDIEADVKYNRLVESKNNKLQEANFYIDRYNERNQQNIPQTESIDDIINYKVAIENIDNNSDPDLLQWPVCPWE